MIRTISILGKHILVRESSGDNASLPAMILLHGNTGSGRWYEKLLGRYSGRMIAPDLPNFGQSAAMDGFSIEQYALWLSYIADYYQLERFILMGHSFGGAIAMEYATSHPEQIISLFLVDSSPVNGLVTPKEHYPIIEMYKTNKDILAQALKAVVPTLEDEGFFTSLVDDAFAMSPPAFIGHAEVLAGADFRDRASAYKGPVHVIYGDQDVLIDDKKASDTAGAFNASLDKLEGCGHSPMVEAPERFWKVVTAHLTHDLE